MKWNVKQWNLSNHIYGCIPPPKNMDTSEQEQCIKNTFKKNISNSKRDVMRPVSVGRLAGSGQLSDGAATSQQTRGHLTTARKKRPKNISCWKVTGPEKCGGRRKRRDQTHILITDPAKEGSPQPPDLNAIQNVWDVFESETCILGAPINMQQLCCAIRSTWTKIYEKHFLWRKQCLQPGAGNLYMKRWAVGVL